MGQNINKCISLKTKIQKNERSRTSFGVRSWICVQMFDSVCVESARSTNYPMHLPSRRDAFSSTVEK